MEVTKVFDRSLRGKQEAKVKVTSDHLCNKEKASELLELLEIIRDLPPEELGGQKFEVQVFQTFGNFRIPKRAPASINITYIGDTDFIPHYCGDPDATRKQINITIDVSQEPSVYICPRDTIEGNLRDGLVLPYEKKGNFDAKAIAEEIIAFCCRVAPDRAEEIESACKKSNLFQYARSSIPCIPHKKP